MATITSTQASGLPLQDHLKAKCSAKTMVNGDAIFTTTGDILLQALVSECYTANDATGSTVQYSVTNNTTSTSATISTATATLASKAAGTSIAVQPGALTNAPVISSNAAGVNVVPWGAIRIPGNSTITVVVGVGSTTGTWAHYALYTPVEDGATLVPAR